ncbi:MAG: hypothetical protein COW63_13370 [Bacteroidetes bacterium CG18_big_fil_WC_8_21_14_2_50_41_14]|nr:MAG: hypothetical protein COW63_13370 [Bacteroidetes bacterium CG18_big_fil_WC_8_21_14_2_50_41_14]
MEEFIAKCQHCGNETSQHILHQEIQAAEGFDSIGHTLSYLDYLCFTVCKTCKNYSFFSIVDGNVGNEFSLYPLEQSIHISIPEAVRKAYNEALRVKKVSPSAFLMLIRKSLEIICKEKDAKGGNLKQKIEYLNKMGQIPKLISDVANSTRSLGNLGAHELHFDWKNKDVEIINDLFQALIEFLYIIPYKLSKLTKKI